MLPAFCTSKQNIESLKDDFESHKVAISFAHINMDPKAYVKSPHQAKTLRIDRIDCQNAFLVLNMSDIRDKTGREYKISTRKKTCCAGRFSAPSTGVPSPRQPSVRNMYRMERKYETD